jgi:hypothetical protein
MMIETANKIKKTVRLDMLSSLDCGRFGVLQVKFCSEIGEQGMRIFYLGL